MPFPTGNDAAVDLQPGTVVGPESFHASNVYGCSSILISHFESNHFKAPPNALSSAELLKLKIKQLD